MSRSGDCPGLSNAMESDAYRRDETTWGFARDKDNPECKGCQKEAVFKEINHNHEEFRDELEMCSMELDAEFELFEFGGVEGSCLELFDKQRSSFPRYISL